MLQQIPLRRTLITFLIWPYLLLGPVQLQSQEVDVNKANFYGLTPLYRAVLDYQDTVAEDLLLRGADPDIGTTAEAKFPERTPLYEAVLLEDRSMVKLLLEYGADPDIRTSDLEKFPGRTPLFEAVLVGNPRIAQLLLEYGADPDIMTGGKDRISPLATAAINGDHVIVHLLLEYGADPLLVLKSGKAEGTIMAFVAGYRVPGFRYNRQQLRTFGNGWLHQLMLTHVDDSSKLDATMKWQDKGCYGYVVQREDRKLSIIARKVYGNPDNWRELAKLNNISRDNPYRAGDCLKVFDVEW